MAFSSVNKMSVPDPGNSNSAQGLLMPKLQYRFRILFDNFGAGGVTTELTKQVIDFKRPNVTFPEIPIEVYNSRIYLAGKPTWEAVSVTLRDDVNGQVTGLVGQQLQKQFDFNEQASAAAGIDYKFRLRCQILDGGNGVQAPNILEVWELYGCYIAGADYQTLNYGENGPVTIALSIRFDNAVQTQLDEAGGANDNLGVGVGAAFGRSLGSIVSGIGR
jgi:hypothetical protein